MTLFLSSVNGEVQDLKKWKLLASYVYSDFDVPLDLSSGLINFTRIIRAITSHFRGIWAHS